MKDIPRILKELLEHIRQNKKWWMIPVLLAVVILYLLITTGGQSSVPVFVYPMV